MRSGIPRTWLVVGDEGDSLARDEERVLVELRTKKKCFPPRSPLKTSARRITLLSTDNDIVGLEPFYFLLLGDSHLLRIASHMTFVMRVWSNCRLHFGSDACLTVT
jgi:hypothetical protein